MQRGVTFNCTCMPQHAHLYSSAIAVRASERANDRPAECNRLMRANMPAFRLASPIIGECAFLVVIIRVIDIASVTNDEIRARARFMLQQRDESRVHIRHLDPESVESRFPARLTVPVSHAAGTPSWKPAKVAIWNQDPIPNLRSIGPRLVNCVSCIIAIIPYQFYRITPTSTRPLANSFATQDPKRAPSE